MTRLGRRFPVHCGYNPPLFGEPVGVVRDSIGVGNYVSGASVNIPWTHTPVSKPNFVIMWVCLLYQSGGVAANLNGVGMPFLFNYNWTNLGGYGGYTEGFIMWNPPPGPWTLNYFPGTGSAPYASCNSVAYRNVGQIGATIQSPSTPQVIQSGPGSIISVGMGGWVTAGGQNCLLVPPPGANIASAGGEPLTIGEIPGAGPTQTINWTSTCGDGAGMCAVNLLPQIPKPML